MKRLIAALILLCMLLSLCACGKTEEPVAPAAPAEETLDLAFGGLEDFTSEEELDENPDRAITRGTEPIYQSVSAQLDGTWLTPEFYFYRETLTDEYKQAYDVLRAGIMNADETINMTVPVLKEDAMSLYKAVLYDSPEIFWIDCKFKVSTNNYGQVTKIKPVYNELAKDIEGNMKKIEEAVAQPLADMWSLKTDIEKVKYAHDYLTKLLSYDVNAAYNQTIYSTFVNKVTVCAGYSHGFQYMMQKMGIPCAFVVGYAGEKHAWSLVKIDGEYYSMDVTWDDPRNGKENTWYYTYFNLTDEAIGKDHTRQDASTKLPAATGTKMSYANYFGGKANGTDFASIHGELPEGYGGKGGFIGKPEETTVDTTGNPYLPSN